LRLSAEEIRFAGIDLTEQFAVAVKAVAPNLAYAGYGKHLGIRRLNHVLTTMLL
jgi:hypothetical protein